MTDEILRISGMDCGACAVRIVRALRGLPGVHAVSVSDTAGCARLTYDEAAVGLGEIARCVQRAGFDVPVETAELRCPGADDGAEARLRAVFGVRSAARAGDTFMVTLWPVGTDAAALPAVLGPGAEQSFDFRAYYGPKVISFLKDFEPGAARVMHLAWGPLDYLARLLLWVLVALHGLIGSYGVAIILLTLMVRALFYPVTAKANASMRKMQQLQPKIKALREQYKDNPQLQYTKMQELQRAEGVNPLGGCLPILLQIPVFFALYATLDGAVELRQVSFLWAKDLAAADTVLTIPLYFFNLPINPLVLIMTGLMVVQQHMTPMSLDPMQKKMMLAMPIIMLLFLYDLPSGLTLYWSVSNFFSIIQMRLQRRHYNDQGATPAKASGK